MLVFDKTEIRDFLTDDQIFGLLGEFGGNPTLSSNCIMSDTICHNMPGEGSHKLYYYYNTKLFRCYTGCDEPLFDIFQLTIKVMAIQYHTDMDLNEAVRWIAGHFGISGREDNEERRNLLEDWEYLEEYSRIKGIELKTNNVILKEYDNNILDRLNYDIKIGPWLKEGISQEVLEKAKIGYYPGGEQITIPHYDINGNFIGLRGRTLSAEEAEKYGKYRPVKICGQLYNHPLGMNLYGLNWSKNAIKILRKAIIFESEKSVLLYATYFGWDNNISVACCGSNISLYQIQLLEECGANEVIVALDRQFQELGDKEYKHLTNNLLKIKDRFQKDLLISFIFDKNMITSYKASPIDEGKEKFLKLYKERIIL